MRIVVVGLVDIFDTPIMKYNVAHFGVGYNVARDRNDSFVLVSPGYSDQ